MLFNFNPLRYSLNYPYLLNFPIIYDINYLLPKPELHLKYKKYDDYKKNLKENIELFKDIITTLIKNFNEFSTKKSKEDIKKDIIDDIKKITNFDKLESGIFSDENISKIIDNLYENKKLVKRICMYKNCKYVNIKVSKDGGAYNFKLKDKLIINNNLFKNDDQYVSNKFRSEVIICYNGKCVKSSSSNCENCDKWVKDRIEFKDKFIDFINKKNVNIFEFIYDNIEYLPVLMLNQEEYHEFFTLYKEYNERNK